MIVSSFPGYVARLNQFIARSHSLFKSARGAGNEDLGFEELAIELFRLQFAHNPLYRSFCLAKVGSPETVTSAAEIPAVPTDVFKEFDFTCLSPHERRRTFHSSGTTGQNPSRHFHNELSLQAYETSLLAGFRTRTSPIPEGCTFAYLTPPPATALHSSLVHMFEVLRRAYGIPEQNYFAQTDQEHAWHLDLPRLTEFLQRSARVQAPVFLFGTAFSFVHLLDHLAARGEPLPLPVRSQLMETGGYKSRSRSMPKSELHALMTRWLGIPSDAILCEYGMSEISSQAYDSAPNRCFRFVPWARALVISPETGLEVPEGERGIVRILDLANIASVLALDTRDLAIRREHSFELLGRAADAEPRGCSLMPAA